MIINYFFLTGGSRGAPVLVALGGEGGGRGETSRPDSRGNMPVGLIYTPVDLPNLPGRASLWSPPGRLPVKAAGE